LTKSSKKNGKYFVIGYKYNTSQLNGNTYYGIQMSDNWFKNRSAEAVGSSTLVQIMLNSGYTKLLPEVVVYPNPTVDYLHFGNDTAIRVSIYDISGSMILQNDITPYISLAIHELSSGAYVAKLKDAHGRSSSKNFLKE
jgi:Secretion system C-terminal sorting domain